MEEADKKQNDRSSFISEQKRLNESIKNNTKQKIEALNQNIFSFRSAMLTITGFSLTMVGVIISVIVTSINVVEHESLAYIGLLCLVLNIILSVLFILNIYHFENNKLSKQIKFNNTYLTEFNNMVNDYCKNKTFQLYLCDKKEFFERKRKEELDIINIKNKNGLLIKDKDYTAHLAIALFLIGFIIILVSFIKFQ